LLGIGIGLIYLRSSLNLSIYEASAALEERRQAVERLEGQVDGVAVEIDQLIDLPRLGPRAERLGLVPPTPEAVCLLPVSTALAFRGARPLPGAGALGRLVRRAVDLAGARRATAAPEPPDDPGRHSAAPSTRASHHPGPDHDPAALHLTCTPVQGCEHCQASASGAAR
jgi:hypothetical protein